MILRLSLLLGLIACLLCAAAGQGRDPAVRELLRQVGLKPKGGQRGQMDIVGFASTARQMDRVLDQCRALAAPRAETLRECAGWGPGAAAEAGVCPHDDYAYAGRLYSLLIPYIRAPRVILFGVFHKARVFQCRDRLVFDRFKTWHGPYGPVAVSPLREELQRGLPPADYTVDNDMHQVEHSIEAIVPFLQAVDRKVEIVPVLVPHMNWDTLDRLAEDFSGALAEVLKANGWELGRDVAVICSTDAVHYGDADWGGTNYCPFGADAAGYVRAVEQDRGLAGDLLCGPLAGDKLREFLYRCVDPEDVTRYRITWCGRFSVPFGLRVVERVDRRLGRPIPAGVLLDYGTSVSEASLPLNGLEGMGVTAPNNFHHFVGYAAIGYR